MDKISVILPIYNVGKDLERCLNSIVSQTYTNLEIILVNDGSTDSSFAICRAFADQDSRIKLINEKNAWRGIARNRGMEAATGDFISFVDPDDILNPIYFEHLHQQIEKYDSDIAVCGYNIILNDDPSQLHSQRFPDQEKAVGVYTWQEWFTQYGSLYNLIWLSLTGPWAKLMKKKCAKGVFFPTDRKYAEDTKTMWKFYLNASKISYEQFAGYTYNQPTNSERKTGIQLYELVHALEEQMGVTLGLGLNIASTCDVYYTAISTACDYTKHAGLTKEYQELSYKLNHLENGWWERRGTGFESFMNIKGVKVRLNMPNPDSLYLRYWVYFRKYPGGTSYSYFFNFISSHQY